MRRQLLAVAVAALVLAGCGGSSRQADSGTLSVGAYGVTPETTVARASTAASMAVCRANARTFARDGLGLLDHFGSAAAYPADLNYVIVREDLARLRSHRCDIRVLGAELRRRLSATQRRQLVDDLPAAMAQAVRESLARARS